MLTNLRYFVQRNDRTLTHPEQNDLSYLFDDMDRPTAFHFRRGSGYWNMASAQSFSGDAVRSLYAQADTQKPTRLAQSTR